LEAAVTSAKPLLTAEEKIMLRVQAKKELERDLAGKAQEILNRFYPPNSSIVKINIDFKMAAKGVIVKTKEINDELKIAQVTTIILVDNRLEIKPKLKEATYKAVAAAIGYNKKRGDRIVLQKVPFHLATTLPETTPGLSPPSTTQPKMVHWLGTMTISGFVIFALIIGFWLFRNLRFSHRQIKPELRQAEPVRPTEAPQLEGLRAFAENNPEKIAELLRNWLTE
jgi:flagellar biosynthesis/type III secretory pathway M-ring protein FliF/YscJ